MAELGADLPTKEQFSAHVDSTFRASLDSGESMELRFFRLDPAISNSIQESFSLMFKAPLDTPPVQNMFRLEHDKLGAMELFLVPVKQKDDCLVFEAVFNRLLV